MSCQQLVELVTNYLEGSLPDDEVARFEEHLAVCPWCARYVEQMRITIEVVGRIDAESLSSEARTTLLAAFSEWRAGDAPRP